MKVEEVQNKELREWIKKQGMVTINEEYVLDEKGYHHKDLIDFTEYINKDGYSIKKVGIDSLDYSILDDIGGVIYFRKSKENKNEKEKVVYTKEFCKEDFKSFFLAPHIWSNMIWKDLEKNNIEYSELAEITFKLV